MDNNKIKTMKEKKYITKAEINITGYTGTLISLFKYKF